MLSLSSEGADGTGPDAHDLDALHSVADYKRAIHGAKLLGHELYRDMLRYNWHAPRRTLTAGEMAELCGFEKWRAANLHYGKLGGAIAKELGHTPGALKGVGVERTVNVAALVLLSGTVRGENVGWTMRPELAQALEEMGWVSP